MPAWFASLLAPYAWRLAFLAAALLALAAQEFRVRGRDLAIGRRDLAIAECVAAHDRLLSSVQEQNRAIEALRRAAAEAEARAAATFTEVRTVVVRERETVRRHGVRTAEELTRWVAERFGAGAL